ncbi:sigma-70 family RNA polymerase sigma factor [Spirulina subsalsa FACHB-351]|uniref:Sigma-70 family RNA polymerase sigma factor n=1 Tax=Spirulina subsalsa FACHB-351 TaxID=234711 RepID=A0ABT3L3L3_9CYAN|nr:sigma-70 family RNA polymerase sigma factor [Spirulina subsalsa]MCW6036083.1 sigma-70 family RNA polymerase sigma factor [Spirulina subsalsa FACHB-351]
MREVLTNDSTQMSDRELVLRCQQGDSTSFQELYQRYQKRVRSTLYSLCGNAMLDDLTQDVFLKAWKGLSKLRQASTFGTWLYRITWNVAQDQRRRFAVMRQEQTEEALSDRTAPVQLTPDLLRLHYQDLVQRGLKQLDLEHRVVLVLHDLEDVPQKEVAKILDIPLGTVKSRLFHARKALRQLLQSEGVSL